LASNLTPPSVLLLEEEIMANRQIRMRKWRDSGKKHKKNKKSVAERKKIKNLLAKWKREGRDDLLTQYFQTQQKDSNGI